MKFDIETVTGNLILIRTSVEYMPPCPVIARSATPATPWFIRLVLFLLTLFRPAVTTVTNLVHLWPPQLPHAARQQVATLSFLAAVVLMLIAENHLEKVIGVMA